MKRGGQANQNTYGVAEPAAVARTRRGVIRAGLLVSGGALAACGQLGAGAAPPAPVRAPVTLEYLTTLNQPQEANHRSLLVDAFQQAHPSLRLEIVIGDSTYAKLKTLVAGGTPPDVTWWAYPEAYLSQLLKEVTPFVRRDRYNVGVFPKAPYEDLCTWRGRILGLPSQSGGNWPVLLYNRDLFRQAGAPEPPARWDDAIWNGLRWLDALQKTTRRGAGGEPASFGINQVPNGAVAIHWPAMWRTGWLSEDFATITCDAPAMLEAMTYLVDLVTRHKAMATPAMLREAFGDTNAESAFKSGRVAMYATFGGGTLPVAQAVRDQGLPLAYAPQPAFATVAAGQMVDPNGLPVGASHPEEGWTLIKWLADTPNWATSRGTTPARVDHFDTWAKELYGAVGTQMRLEVYRDSLRYAGRIDPMFRLPSFRQMYSEVVVPALGKLYAGEASVTTTLREIKTPLQALVPRDLPA